MVSRGLAAYLVVGLMAVTLGAAATEAVRLKLPDKSPIVARAKTIPVPPAITLKAATGGPKDVDDVASWMLSGNADTDEAGARAVAVAVAAAKSPRVTTPATYSSMIERVRTAWAMAVCAPRLFRLDVAPGFRPASGTTGGDFGGRNSERSLGFARVTEATPNVAGRSLRAIKGAGPHPLFSDALDGVEQFAVALPNGRHRIILMTVNTPEGRFGETPLGRRIVVNGEPRLIGPALPPTWLVGGEVSGTGQAPLLVSGGSGPPIGGGLTVETTVTDGTLRISFLQRDGYGATVAGILIEPASRPTQVHVFGAAAKASLPVDACIAKDREVDEMLTELVPEPQPFSRLPAVGVDPGSGGGGGDAPSDPPPPVSSS
jgi:hypothetical protein